MFVYFGLEFTLKHNCHWTIDLIIIIKAMHWTVEHKFQVNDVGFVA